MKSVIDLHMHSCYSEDGEYSPATLVQMCAEAGIHMMAIADHNCVKAIDEAAQEAEKYNIKYYPAIEIDCTHQGTNYHVLGYHIDHTSPDFAEIEQNIRNQCLAASKARLHLVNKNFNFDITEEELMAVTGNGYWPEHWTGEAIAEVLLNQDRFLDAGLLLSYREGGDRSDNPYVNFYWDYCAPGKSCYAPMSFPTMTEIIDLIHRNHGKAVLAHPGVNLKENLDKIHQLVSLGLDGIEAFSSYHNRQTAQKLHEIAGNYNLFVTYGSDFHGKTKPAIQIGYCGIKEEMQ